MTTFEIDSRDNIKAEISLRDAQNLKYVSSQGLPF